MTYVPKSQRKKGLELFLTLVIDQKAPTAKITGITEEDTAVKWAKSDKGMAFKLIYSEPDFAMKHGRINNPCPSGRR